MRNLYDLLWVDAIVNSKGYKSKESDWKFGVYFIITVANSLNFFVLLLWLEFFNVNARKFFFIFETNTVLTSALGGFLNFGLPFTIINYFAIFYKKRYVKLISKYSSTYNGKLALRYILGSILLVVITVIIVA